MYKFRIIGALTALVAVLAFSVIAAGSASAEEHLWVLLPGSAHETLKGSFGKESTVVKGGAILSCKKAELLLTDKELEASSELLEEGAVNKMATLWLWVLHFTGCTFAGLSENSLGDKAGIVLWHVHVHNCMISAGHYGLLIKPLPVHIEIPSTSLLLLIEGSFIAEITEESAARDRLVIEQKEGKQSIEKCEGGSKDTLLTSVDGGAFTETGFESKEAVIEWDKTIDTAGETLMEN